MPSTTASNPSGRPPVRQPKGLSFDGRCGPSGSGRRRIRSSAWILAILLAAGPLLAHPYHTSIGEADWNSQTQRLEVALRFVPDDLDRALRASFGPLPQDAPAEETDRRIVRWLEQGFQVFSHGADEAAPAPIEWVGKEVSIEHIWIYFQVPLADGRDGAILEHRLLFDIEPGQINTLLLRRSDHRTTLTFTRERSRQPLALE